MPKHHVIELEKPMAVSPELKRALGGRPRKFKSVKQFEDAVTKYMSTAVKPSLMGMYLEVAGGSSQWWDYSQKPEFAEGCKAAKERMIAYAEGELIHRKGS